MLLEKVLEGVLGGGVGEEAPKIRTVPMPRWPPLGFPLAPGYHKPRAEPVSGTASKSSLVRALLF